LITSVLPGVVVPYVPSILCQDLADLKDPEDRVFIESMDWSTIKPDADVGAVLCGFDAYVSKYPPALFLLELSLTTRLQEIQQGILLPKR
jgi:hypothetical protein